MTMTAETQAAAGAPGPPRRRRGFRVTLAAVLLLVVAGAVTGTVWYRHYADAPSLRVGSTEIGWIGNVPKHDVRAGPYSAAITTAGRGDQRTFVLYVYNPSKVTQTVLGLMYPDRHSATPDHVTLSSRDPGTGSSNGAPFTEPPVAIAPNAHRALYYTVKINRCLPRQLQMDWTSLDLRVKSGAFTRHEVLDFGTEDSAYTIQGVARRC